jgi:hypothetical protein
MKRILLGILIVLLPGISEVFAQKKAKGLSKAEEGMLADAEYFYEEGNYLRALPLYVQLANLNSEQLYYKLRAGICYMYKADEKEKSLAYLDTVYKADPQTEDILFYLGKAHHLNYKFDDAIRLLNQYLKSDPDPKLKERASQTINYCNNGKILVPSPVKAEIQNLGGVVNTSASEFAPVISSDESILIYTYRGERSTGGLMNTKFKPDPVDGEYYEDIFITQRVGNEWLSPEPIGTNINTLGHDASIALSPDGQVLFLYKSTPKDKGDIYMSKLEGETWMPPVKLGPTINTNSWEGSCSISSDGKTLYFASERPGGSGGRDIYVSQRAKDGSWGKAVNLGPVINTKLNEDAPFIHPDGITLFFSSEGHNSIGGSDIMYSVRKDGKWSEPVNLGYPINSTEDDRYYVLSADGETGYYSSSTKGSYGQQDIYTVTPGYQGERPVLALVVGMVTADDKPVDAKIKVSNTETGEMQGEYNSNSATGKYLIALTPGNNYTVAIEVEGIEPMLEYVNVKSLDTYVQVQKDFKLYSEDYKKNMTTASVDTTESLQKKLDEQIQRYREESKLVVYETKVYQELVKKYGDIRKDSVTYTVELGTFENPADFDPTKLEGLGQIEKRLDANGNTTYSIGPFKTLLDAEIFRYKVMQKDTSMKNAVVTVNDKGDRKLIQQYYANEYTRKGYVIPTETKVIKSKGNTSTLPTTVVGLTDRNRYTDIKRDFGRSEIEGLTFKVEIASVTDTNDFKLQHFAKMGKIERKKYPDGKYRYTMGPFKTLAEADSFKTALMKFDTAATRSLVTVFYFGQRKTVTEFFDDPCAPDRPQPDFAFFVGKDLNDTSIYNRLVRQAGNICMEGLVFRVQIGAYRFPQNYKYKNLKDLEPPPALIKPYADGITRFTMREFKTLREAEMFRQTCIRKGTTDAWVTAEYKGERKLLQELIANNFYGRSIN